MARITTMDPWICIQGKVFKRSGIRSIGLVDGPEKFRYIRMVVIISGNKSPCYLDFDYNVLDSLLRFINNPQESNFIYR